MTRALFAMALLVGCACASLRDAATVASNGSLEIGQAASAVLQKECVDGYKGRTAAQTSELDVYCLPASHAFDAYRATQAALRTAIQVADLRGDPADPQLAELMTQLAHEADDLAASLAAIGRRP